MDCDSRRTVVSSGLGDTSVCSILHDGGRKESGGRGPNPLLIFPDRQIPYPRYNRHIVNEATGIWRSLYPSASGRIVELDGQRMHYLDAGPEGDAAETLLCVHGNPTWSFYWRHFVDAWSGKYRVVVPDHIGCGLSDKPQEYDYRLARHTANLSELITQLDLRNVTLLAHDWGGAIGLGAVLAQPQRFSRLVLFNTGAFHGERCPWRIRVCRMPGLGPAAVRGMNAFAKAALVMATAKPERFTAAVRAGYLAPYDSYADRVAIQRFVEDIPLHPSHPSYETLSALERGLPSLADLPISLIWGMRDWCFTPKFLDRFIHYFPRAEVHRFSDAGHYVVEDAHEQIVPLVDDFLTRHPTSPAEAAR